MGMTQSREKISVNLPPKSKIFDNSVMFFFIWFYRFCSVAFLPLLGILLIWRILKKKEDLARIKEKFGIADLKKWHRLVIGKTEISEKNEGEKIQDENRIEEKLRILVHAASVGEANSCWKLICEFLASDPKIRIIFTTTTITSARLIEQKISTLKLPSGLEGADFIIHQFLPFDSYFWIEKFLGIWQPKAILLVESEIWPNLIFSAKEKNIPLFLINARLSDKSSRNWLLARKIGLDIFSKFSAIFAQSKNDQEKFSKLTNAKIHFLGNLKAQIGEANYNQEKVIRLKSEIGNRPFWLCASTHRNEEETIFKVHQMLKNEFPEILTIIAIRHPNRSEEVARIFPAQKLAIRSKNEKIDNCREFYIVDSIGELGDFYRLADFAFIGGSMVEIGGHNPFEAITQDCAVISGKNVSNFSEIYENLLENQAAIMVLDEKELFLAALKFLKQKNELEIYRKNALGLLAEFPEASQEIIAKIKELKPFNIKAQN